MHKQSEYTWELQVHIWSFMDSNHACLPIVQEDLGWWWWGLLLVISPDISNWKIRSLTLNWYLGCSMAVLPSIMLTSTRIPDRCHHFAFSKKLAVNRDTRRACKWRRRISGTWRDIRSYCRSVGRVRRLSRNPKLRCLHVPSGKYVQFLASSLEKISIISQRRPSQPMSRRHVDIEGNGGCRGRVSLVAVNYLDRVNRQQHIDVPLMVVKCHSYWYMHLVIKGANTTTWTTHTNMVKWKNVKSYWWWRSIAPCFLCTIWPSMISRSSDLWFKLKQTQKSIPRNCCE